MCYRLGEKRSEVSDRGGRPIRGTSLQGRNYEKNLSMKVI